jgi:iron-sulfur cluster insertion protein
MTNTDKIILSHSAIERVIEIRKKPENQGKFLRISVDSGGCSGFQYLFNLDNKNQDDDLVVLKKDSDLIAVTDETSLQFLTDCKVDFVKELGASYFKVENPNAASGCGCGASFSI